MKALLVRQGAYAKEDGQQGCSPDAKEKLSPSGIIIIKFCGLNGRAEIARGFGTGLHTVEAHDALAGIAGATFLPVNRPGWAGVLAQLAIDAV